MDILKEIKSALYKIRRSKPAKHNLKEVLVVFPEAKKPNAKTIAAMKEIKTIVKKKQKIVKKTKPTARKKTLVTIDGQQLSLSQIARNYGLEIATVRARYRVGNRGKLLIRPSHRKPT